jgi:RNA polymerase sigma factor (sigma-70 family)
MQTLDDLALLREYAAHHSEAAFETLVARRVRFVFSAALRQVRDPLLAEEITQAVFIILSKKAGSIRSGTVLSGWLFKTIRYAAIAQTRTAARRRRYEQEAQMQSEIQPAAPDPLWEQIAPLLDEGLAQLGERDRQAILLRYLESKSLAEVGSFFGTNEDTARMRISRALEKLRHYFMKRGVVSTADFIAGAISANSLQAVPIGLATKISATVLKGSAAAGPILTLVQGTLKIMAWIKTKTAIAFGLGTLLAGAAVLTLHEQEQQNREQEQKIRAEEEQIRAQEQRGDLSPGQRAQLENRLDQLRAQQNQLRTRQGQLYERETNAFARPSQQVSPFTMVQYEENKVFVAYAGMKYELAAINGLSTSDMLAFCRRQYKELWPKRFAEDLVVVLAQMGQPVNPEMTVTLTLIDPATGEKKTVERASMTKENRQAISTALRGGDTGKPTN